jgi:RNA polymerase sigma-70 factor (ECF subfamily)
VTVQTTEPATADARELVARFQAGDVDAYGEIYRLYRNTVYFYIRRKIPTDHQLAEDLTHDTFVLALRFIGRWEWQGKDLRAWLITIARNVVIDHFKLARTRYETPGGVPDSDKVDHSPEGRPESAVIEHLRNIALLTALTYLTQDQHACIVHRFVQGLSVAETAAAMSREEGAVKSLQVRALASLAQHFDGKPWR